MKSASTYLENRIICLPCARPLTILLYTLHRTSYRGRILYLVYGHTAHIIASTIKRLFKYIWASTWNRVFQHRRLLTMTGLDMIYLLWTKKGWIKLNANKCTMDYKECSGFTQIHWQPVRPVIESMISSLPLYREYKNGSE